MVSIPKTLEQQIDDHEAALIRLREQKKLIEAIGPDIYDVGDVIRIRYNYNSGGTTRVVLTALMRCVNERWSELRYSNTNDLNWSQVQQKISRLYTDPAITDPEVEISRTWRSYPGLSSS